jgi:hypothetical protein
MCCRKEAERWLLLEEQLRVVLGVGKRGKGSVGKRRRAKGAIGRGRNDGRGVRRGSPGVLTIGAHIIQAYIFGGRRRDGSGGIKVVVVVVVVVVVIGVVVAAAHHAVKMRGSRRVRRVRWVRGLQSSLNVLWGHVERSGDG